MNPKNGSNENVEFLKRRIFELEKKYNDLFENSPDGIFQVTQEGKLINANSSFLKIHNYSSLEEISSELGDSLKKLFVSAKDFEEFLEALKKERKVNNFETQTKKRDGSIIWVLINGRAVLDPEGRTIYYEGTIKDITEKKLAEKALRESEERYKVAIEHSNDGVAIIAQSKHIYVNRRFVEIFEYENQEEIVGKPITFVVHPDDAELVKEISEKRMRGEPVPDRYEFKGLTKTKKVIYLEVSAAKITFRGEPAYLVFLRDITQRKESERRLAEEKERLTTLLENAPIGIALISEKGVFRYVNPKFKEIFGYDIKDVPDGKTFLKKLFPDPSYRKKVIAEWIENVRSTQIGQKFPRIFTIESKDGTKKIINFIPVRLATNEHIVAFEDITERIEAEEALRRSRDQLERLNVLKSKAIDHISHELKTPTSILLGSLRILKSKLKEINKISPFEKILDVMERNATRILEISRETDEIFKSQVEFDTVSLTMEMDDFLRRVERIIGLPHQIRFHWEAIKAWLTQTFLGEKEKKEEIELFSFLKDVLKRAKQKIPHRKIEIELEDGKGTILKINRRILYNTLQAIIKNAIENTPDGGKIEIKVERNEDKVFVHIKDTGVGIIEENLAFLFEGLFHTEATELYKSKKPYDFGAGGKGLELFMIKRYALKYGFEINVKSKRCIYLPTEKDICPGDVLLCKNISSALECYESGWTIFTLTFTLPDV